MTRLPLLCVITGLVCAGCAQTSAYRTTVEAQTSKECIAQYQSSDDYSQNSSISNPTTQPPLEATAVKTCWTTAYEKHSSYDLLFAEFDDEGWENGSDGKSHIAAVMDELTKLSADQALDIIVFTHGWHHTASAFDNNVKQFRYLLNSVAKDEQSITDNTAGGRRRVVGIYIGWRGDSVEGPGLEMTSIWDRKTSAENVSLGEVQTLFAHLHNFYAAHQRHQSAGQESRPSGVSANAHSANSHDVRMLVIGHSFGGLIAYRSLAPRLIVNVIDTYDEGLGEQKLRYAYSFGDLVVLINPAFEGLRFEALARASASRPYFPAGPGVAGQLPIIVVAQSKGDTGTGFWFPTFRWLTTPVDDPTDSEREGNLHTVGWTSRYITHTLDCPQVGHVEKCLPAPTSDELTQWWASERQIGYRDFESGPNMPGGFLVNRQQGTSPIKRHPYDPIWVVQTDRSIIEDHDDVLNPNLVEFTRELYFTILKEEDCRLEDNRGCPVPLTGETHGDK